MKSIQLIQIYQIMRVPDRALFLLASKHFGVKVSLNETLAIKLADGLYDEANTYYMKVFDSKRSLKNHLPIYHPLGRPHGNNGRI